MAFTTVTHFEDIHTLEQLDSRGLKIGAASGSLKKVFGSMENVFGWRNMSSPTIKSLQDKYIVINSSRSALDRVAKDGNICCIERFTDVKVILSVGVDENLYFGENHLRNDFQIFMKFFLFSTNIAQKMEAFPCT